MSSNMRARNVCLRCFGAAALAGAVAVSFSTGSASAEASLDALNGSWHGNGTLSFESGQTENISCNGYYKGGNTLSVVIRCKGTSSFELRSKLETDGTKLTGSWEERTYNATGGATGTAAPGNLRIKFDGSLNGDLAMSFTSSSQTVSVTVGTKGAGIKGVRVSFQRD